MNGQATYCYVFIFAQSLPGTTFGQVKVKSKPTKLTFGGNAHHPRRENIVSVSMDRKTILLYNLDEPENALELAFQSRYGTIVNFHWFRDGFIMVAFSLGFVVVISTRAFGGSSQFVFVGTSFTMQIPFAQLRILRAEFILLDSPPHPLRYISLLSSESFTPNLLSSIFLSLYLRRPSPRTRTHRALRDRSRAVLRAVPPRFTARHGVQRRAQQDRHVRRQQH